MGEPPVCVALILSRRNGDQAGNMRLRMVNRLEERS
jgi:hypothetical protein